MAEYVLCSIEGCNNPVLNKMRGWCSKHYQRWRHTGDPRLSRINRDQTGSPCSLEGCNEPAKYKGYCSFHGDRLRRTGDPRVASLNPKHRAHQRWLAEHRDHAGDGCLIWPFHRGPNGRGVVGGTSAPHAMCVLAYGEPPTSKHEAAHRCGKGHEGCVNPRHLRWATRVENEADKLIHGTMRRGTTINTNKLTEAQVREIRSSVLSGVTLADIYGVSTAAISSVRTRKSWAWLD